MVESIVFANCMCEYHVYLEIWTTVEEETLICSREMRNREGRSPCCGCAKEWLHCRTHSSVYVAYVFLVLAVRRVNGCRITG